MYGGNGGRQDGARLSDSTSDQEGVHLDGSRGLVTVPPPAAGTHLAAARGARTPLSDPWWRPSFFIL